MPPLLQLLAQLPTSDVLRIVDQGGSKAVIAVLVIVVAYLSRENTKLHEALHNRDTAYAEKVTALLQAHGTAISVVMEERIDEMEQITRSVTALDTAVKTVETLTRGRRT